MPNLIQQYNHFKGGIDRLDENLEAYRIGIGGKKWWWNVWTWLLDTAVHNAWQLHRLHRMKPAENGASDADEGNEEEDADDEEGREQEHMSQLDFRRYIVQSYLRGHGQPPAKRGPKGHKALSSRVTDEVRYDGLNHWIVDAGGHKPECAECGGRTSKKCDKCDLGLHVDCFKKFHVR